MSLNKSKSIFMLAVALAQGAAWGQSALRDPTFPPHGAVLAVPNTASGLTTSGTVLEHGAAIAPPVVQVMLVGPSRKHAVIDGHLLKPGEHIDQWRLTQITANGVIMQSAMGTQKISAYPLVKKNVIAGETP